MKKIVITVLIVILSVFFVTPPGHASQLSQKLVSEGRDLLFDNGNFTYSGIIAANDKFEQAVVADSTDAEANFFYAVTRVLVFGLEEGSGAGFETFLDVLEAFGITRSDNDYVDAGPPYNDPPDLYGQYNPPNTVPTGEAVSDFLGGPAAGVIDGAITNLNVPTSIFNVVVTAQETGDEAVEIDYGDVLLARAVLYGVKSFILIATAYDLDMDLRRFFVLDNADVIQIQRDILDKYPDLFKLTGGGPTASLSRARSDLLSGIQAYREAISFIQQESDYQADDLFYFESEEDKDSAEDLLAQLTEIETSLTQNRPAIFETLETWLLTDQDENLRYELEIEKDANGDFLGGEFWGLDEAFGANVEAFDVSSTNAMFTLTFYGDCPGELTTATFTGGLNGIRITDGSLLIEDSCATNSEPFNGTLELEETEIFEIDFNLVFGNTGKGQLDVREVLPIFDPYDEPTKGTFPGNPVLNGIIPDFQTNDDVTRELDLQPVGTFMIPSASISIDGNFGDWSGIAPVFTDLEDDEEFDSPDFDGMDLKAFYIAEGTSDYYFRMTFYDGRAEDSFDGATPSYLFEAASSRDGHTAGDLFCVALPTQGWVNLLQESGISGQPIDLKSYSNFSMAGSNSVEWQVPKADMGSINGKFVAVWTHMTGFPQIYDTSDYNHTGMKLNSASVSGTVTCADHDGTGNIFIRAYDGPDPATARELGNTHLAGPGPYSIEGLPIDGMVHLFGTWDADDNGIRTFGDLVGDRGPDVVQAGGTSGVDFSIGTIIDDNFILTKPGLYRVFGSNTFTFPEEFFGPWDPNEVAWGDGWTLIGEGDATQTFQTAQYFKTILIIWHEDALFYFDASEDLTAGTAFATHANGTSSPYQWITSGLRNFDADPLTVEPFYMKGHPDELYAQTEGWYGFAVFTMPDDNIGVNASRQLKLTLVSGFESGPVGLGDVIVVLRALAGLSPGMLGQDGDIDGDGQITLREAIYLLHRIAVLR